MASNLQVRSHMPQPMQELAQTLRDGRALVLVRAVDEHLLLVGDLDDQLARAGLTAGAAVGALFLVDLGNALVVDVQSVELAGG